ncbi:choice-of-anchor tandem repeat GloVer-containing protein [Candidatus Auribacterota bacterium]
MRKTLLSILFSIILIGSFAVYAQAEPFTLLHVFPWTDDGQRPRGTLTLSDGTLYGATSYGGDSNSGVVFSMDTSGGSYTQLHQFAGQPDDGAVPYWAKLTLSGDTLYGMTVDGGTSNIGTVYSLSTDGGSFTILHHFTGGADDGADPYGALTLSGDSLYGMTYAGGDSNWGVVFSLDTAGGSFTVLHDFIGGLDDGGVPEGSLLLSGSTLYGEAFGGAESGGMIFSIDTSGASFTIVHSFTPGPGGGPNRDITIDGDKIYGMTGSGGVDGTVYRLDTAGGGYTVLHEFAGGTGDGSRPFGTVMINDGVAYGMTFNGGDSNYGVLFSVGTDGDDYRILHEFLSGADDGRGPQGDLIMSGVMLYGMTQYGGSGQPTTYGTVFSFDATVPEPSTILLLLPFIVGFGWWYRKRNGKSVIARSGSDEAISKINEVQRDCHALRARNDRNNENGEAKVLRTPKSTKIFGKNPHLFSLTLVLVIFASLILCFAPTAQAEPFTLLKAFPWTGDGKNPKGTLTLSGDTLYGTTYQGGESDVGVVYSIDTVGGSFTLLHEFVGQPDGGENPYWSKLALSGDMLYGMTYQGGVSNVGTVYSLDTAGGSFTILHHFIGGADDGEDPYGSLVTSGDILYGMTYEGGDSNTGTIFSMDTAGGAFTILHHFHGGTSDGWYPSGTMVLSGSTLYGYGGAGEFSSGSIFTIDTAGGSYTLIHSFSPSAGGYPNINITIDGDKIYGMTGSEGVNGTVYRLDTSGGGFTVLHEFAGGTGDGSRPFGTVVANDGVLYGMTFNGGDSDHGVLFSVGTDGEDYAILHEFLGGEGDGEGPQGDLIMSGVMLYGVTGKGGIDMPTTYGTIFSFDVTAPEPSTLLLLLPFLGGFAWWYRKRNGKTVIARSGSDEAISKIDVKQKDCFALRARNDI